MIKTLETMTKAEIAGCIEDEVNYQTTIQTEAASTIEELQNLKARILNEAYSPELLKEFCELVPAKN